MGVALHRIRLGFRAVHTQVRARSNIWIKDHEVIIQRVEHGQERSDGYLDSSIQVARINSIANRLRLTEQDHSVLHMMKRQYFPL